MPNREGSSTTIKTEKQIEAVERNSKTAPERRRSFARQLGFNRNSDRIRAGA
jgi:hypothetical protein